MSKNLLLEIGTEEMPANMMSGIVEQMHALAGAKLDEARIAFEKVDVYATPRRLAVIVTAADKSRRGICTGTGDFRGRFDQRGRIYLGAGGE